MSGGLPPHVVMVVGNDVTTDTRVRRMAATLASTGRRVTVLALASGPVREESWLGAVRLVRVPVRFDLRDAYRARRARRQSRRIRVGYRTAGEARAARDRLVVRQREVRADLTDVHGARRPALYVQAVVLRARRELVRARAGIQGRLDARRTQKWTSRDRRRGASRRFVAWRRELPEIDDYAIAFGPVLSELRPDVVHAHDVHLVGLAARSGVPWVYDAHEDVAGLSLYGGRTARRVVAYADLERAFVRRAERVVAVSPQLAGVLQARYDLACTPSVVMNVPSPQEVESQVEGSLRDAIGLPDDVTLLVYSGGVTSARGVETAVDALALLPDVHLAVVAVPHTRTGPCRELRARAEQRGVSDRLHLVEPVAPNEVVAFLRSADVGLLPLLRFGSHDVALANKLFEYAYAGLPLVVSDCPAQAEFVEKVGIGRVHRAGDADGLAEAVRAVLADVGAYRVDPEDLAQYQWPAQETVLRDLYDELAPVPDIVVARRPMLVVGPTNTAGQGREWANATARACDGLATHVLALENERLDFPADERVAPATFTDDASWQDQQLRRATTEWTHVLFEAGRPVLGTRFGTTFVGDAQALRSAGVRAALVFHGSEIRDPARHAAAYPFSPFRDPTDPLTARLQRQVDFLRPAVESYDGQRFVSTLDLLDDVPGAAWLPVVIDRSRWRARGAPLRRRVPLLVHAPSNTALKGTQELERALAPLLSSGRVEYRRLQGVPPEDMPAALAAADVVLDQFSVGIYGVLACQAMALGKLVVSHVHAITRDRLPRPLPVVEANPQTLRTVLEEVLADRVAARAVAAEGPDFVAELHDGRRSAQALAPFIAS